MVRMWPRHHRIVYGQATPTSLRHNTDIFVIHLVESVILISSTCRSTMNIMYSRQWLWCNISNFKYVRLLLEGRSPVDSWYSEIKDYNYGYPGFSMGTGGYNKGSSYNMIAWYLESQNAELIKWTYWDGLWTHWSLWLLLSGHFTQVVWKESRELGFGYAQASNGAWYYCCNYYPAGNMQGQFPPNVGRMKASIASVTVHH